MHAYKEFREHGDYIQKLPSRILIPPAFLEVIIKNKSMGTNLESPSVFQKIYIYAYY